MSIRAPTFNESWLIKQYHMRKAQSNKQSTLNELDQVELFIVRMLKSGLFSVHEILGVAAEMSFELRPYFQRCYNRYFQCGADAITQMKQELRDDNFDVLCDALVFSASYGRKEIALQIEEYMVYINRIRAFRRQQNIRQKETRFAFVMVLPLAAFIIVQIYPWLMQAAEQLSVIW